MIRSAPLPQPLPSPHGGAFDSDSRDGTATMSSEVDNKDISAGESAAGSEEKIRDIMKEIVNVNGKMESPSAESGKLNGEANAAVASNGEEKPGKKLPSPIIEEGEDAIEGEGDGAVKQADKKDDLALKERRNSETQNKPPVSLSRRSSKTADSGAILPEKVLKASPAMMQELTSSPDSIPVRALPSDSTATPSHKLPTMDIPPISIQFNQLGDTPVEVKSKTISGTSATREQRMPEIPETSVLKSERAVQDKISPSVSKLAASDTPLKNTMLFHRPTIGSRAVSTPTSVRRRQSPSRPDGLSHRRTSHIKQARLAPAPAEFEKDRTAASTEIPLPTSIPLPPLSFPTYLQLELSSSRPSPLYIQRPSNPEFPYESSRVKLERLQNFLMLPPQLEQVLGFGALACLDSWLYSFTILPLRFVKAVFILVRSWIANVGVETGFVTGFIVKGIGRVWERRKLGGALDGNTTTRSRQASISASVSGNDVGNGKILESIERPRAPSQPPPMRRTQSAVPRRHKRMKSVPSTLMPDDKADILKGLLMICTCVILMKFDASRMYHRIRGQAAFKLYVIYNILEVGDRLFSALGQDVLECLFSREALERKPDGRSKVSRPFWLFVLALTYTVVHSTALFYQVITLNVAVNSYSNALISLLMSNQFVEIKSTVFKKFEKDNLFQLTCADVVERFQLWLMLTIIAGRNIVETGGLGFGNGFSSFSNPSTMTTNSSLPLATPPKSSSSILPRAFTLLQSNVLSFSSLSSVHAFLPTIGHVLSPFLFVLGSEMLVDWLKHAYINKFNNTRPNIYGRFLDILAKDYYTNAFGDQNLTKRFGLPVIPLACLFIRAAIQTYQMFLASWIPQLPPAASTTSLASIHSLTSSIPTATNVTEAFLHGSTPNALLSLVSGAWTYLRAQFLRLSITSNTTTLTLLIFSVVWIILLLFKLSLGIFLLSLARRRYKGMKEREYKAQRESQAQSQAQAASTQQQSSQQPQTSTSASQQQPNLSLSIPEARRAGPHGIIEVSDSTRRHIYDDDPEGLKRVREREERDREKARKSAAVGEGQFLGAMEGVSRYEMVAKRIW